MLLQAIYYMICYAFGWVEARAAAAASAGCSLRRLCFGPALRACLTPSRAAHLHSRRAQNLDKAIEVAVNTYAGQPAELLRSQTRSWFKADVFPRTRPFARTVLDAHRAAGARCVLASSTTQFAAEAARAAYGLQDVVCSVLEVDADGALTGRIASLAFGRAKAARVREWAAANGVCLKRSTFYSDSFADATLLSEVGRPVCVNPDRRLRKLALERGWEIQDWGRSPVPLVRRKSFGAVPAVA